MQLHAAALSSLRSEVAELNSRLVAATRAREATEAALVRAEVQAARAEQRAEQQAARHEERLTELHSVIAELGRQLERHRATVIAEEDESGKGENETTDSVNLCTVLGLCLPPTEIYGPRPFDVLTRSPLGSRFAVRFTVSNDVAKIRDSSCRFIFLPIMVCPFYIVFYSNSLVLGNFGQLNIFFLRIIRLLSKLENTMAFIRLAWYVFYDES